MEHIKLLACQTKAIHTYKNTKPKLLKCCANIYFNAFSTGYYVHGIPFPSLLQYLWLGILQGWWWFSNRAKTLSPFIIINICVWLYLADFNLIFSCIYTTGWNTSKYPPNFGGSNAGEEFYLYCLTLCRLCKVTEDRRPHLHGRENPRSGIKLSCNGRFVIDWIYICRTVWCTERWFVVAI
jgi:hypothetical protein